MKIVVIAALFCMMCSCNKPVIIEPVPPPAMKYLNLNDAEVTASNSKGVDIDENGSVDFRFHTLLVGDPLLQQDKLQYYATSGIENYLLNSDVVGTPCLYKNDPIEMQYVGFDWFPISAIILAEKVTGMTGSPFWRGNWKDASHRYLPVRINRNGQDYFGWIELSFNTDAGKLTLHRAAISINPGVAIKAGY